jgi:hypothetical protein
MLHAIAAVATIECAETQINNSPHGTSPKDPRTGQNKHRVG